MGASHRSTKVTSDPIGDIDGDRESIATVTPSGSASAAIRSTALAALFGV